MHVQTKVDWYAEQYVADVCIYRGFIVYSTLMAFLQIYYKLGSEIETTNSSA